MNVAEVIRAKRDGHKIGADEIRTLIASYTSDSVPDYQMAALLMAIYFRGLDDEELAHWTHAMLHSGSVLTWPQLRSSPVDKHSTGGVGDKISIPLAPAVAACGGVVPMISGRGLGHTGGTLDKLESIPGFRTRISLDECRALIAGIGVAMMGQTEEIAPADRRLYALRDVTSTVDSIPLIASSIMSKKLAEGISGLVLDVKVGSGAFMKTHEDALRLARTLAGIGERCGCRTIAWLTRMDRPLGRCAGNALEIAESVEILRGEGPADVRELVIAFGGEMLALGGVAPDAAGGRAAIAASLDDGTALQRFREMVGAQGGDSAVADDVERLPRAPRLAEYASPQSGFIAGIDTELLGRACVVLGAGRATSADAIDPSVGFEVLHTTGSRVATGEPLLRIHYADSNRLEACKERLAGVYRFSDSPPPELPLLIQRVDGAEVVA